MKKWKKKKRREHVEFHVCARCSKPVLISIFRGGVKIFNEIFESLFSGKMLKEKMLR